MTNTVWCAYLAVAAVRCEQWLSHTCRVMFGPKGRVRLWVAASPACEGCPMCDLHREKAATSTAQLAAVS
jgi:hypothetical protein